MYARLILTKPCLVCLKYYAGITHISLGNHEADLQLNVLKERLGELSQRGRVVVLNSNVSGLGRHTRELDIVTSNCGKIRVALFGFLSDESEMFRDGTFRGLSIANVKEKYDNAKSKSFCTFDTSKSGE